MYLCYDIRGIQSFVFQIPRLRYIVGGSALVDRFDRKTVPELASRHGWTLISAGGGKGAFACDLTQADRIQSTLIKEVHAFGADIRFGRDDDYSEAAHCADRLFPYLPRNLDGHPCEESGLYPVKDGGIHEVVERRIRDHGDELGRWFEKRLLKKDAIDLIPGLPADKLAFMRDVEAGTPGSHAIGGHNRWAVICMDGNDMGTQFGAMQANAGGQGMIDWVREMSKALDACSVKACLAAIQLVAKEWSGEARTGQLIQDEQCHDESGALVLPVRPLVVGGDDITVLCHASYAASFVREACRVFDEESRKLATKAAKEKGLTLWPATGDHITISAGVLYCSTSLPLATAIPYTEKLLAMAKRKGRALKTSGEKMPSPACVDFEAVTESMIDDPQTRRERELFFLDGDLRNERVELTCRPYAIEDFGALQDEVAKLKLPGTILHQLLPSLRAGYHDRRVFRWRIAKHQPDLAAALEEDENEARIGAFPKGSRWKRSGTDANGWTRQTDVIDLALLAQESRRTTQEDA
jgi:hypothetical protein